MKRSEKTKKPRRSRRERLNIIKQDLRSKNSIGLAERLKMWRLGFQSEKYYLYNLKVNDFRDYLSDYDFELTRFINHKFGVVLSNKLIFEKIASQYIKVARNYAIIEEGRIFTLDPDSGIGEVEDIIRVCQAQKGLVIKPIVGGRGRGVGILKVDDGQILINGVEMHREKFRDYVMGLDNYIVSEHLKQGQYASSLYPGTTNTLRVIVMVDPDTSQPFIAGAVQRMGGKFSGGLDNFAQGGYSANIDLETGELGPAVTRLDTLNKSLVWYNRHPDSDALIEGARIPDWANVKEKLIGLTANLPYIKYVGWDVVLMDDDIAIIEGNYYPNPRVNQLHRPLLVDPRVRRFYEYHGVI